MEASQINRTLFRPVITAAAIIGTLEALIWTGLSLVSILFYHSVILIDNSILNSYQFYIYNLFLNPNVITNEDVIVTPEVFSVFMYIYLALSFLWLIVSLHMLWAMTRNKWRDGYTLLGRWAGIAIVIAALDIVLMSLIAADFVTVQNFFSLEDMPLTTTTSSTTSVLTTTTLPPTTTSAPGDPTTDIIPDTTEESTTTIDPTTAGPTTLLVNIQRMITNIHILQDPLVTESTQHLIYTSYVIIMSLAARGYILWIVNVVFAIILIKFASRLKKDAVPSLLPIMDAYRSGTRPWNNLYEETDIGNIYDNNGFKDDNDTSFPRSDSFINKDAELRGQNPLSNGSNPYENFERNHRPHSPPNPNVLNGRLAKIGKKGGRRTPPQKITPPNVPYIPDPDYTPPDSPRSKPKSVLRPKSNYVL